jgi:hypothetical protein
MTDIEVVTPEVTANDTSVPRPDQQKETQAESQLVKLALAKVTTANGWLLMNGALLQRLNY